MLCSRWHRTRCHYTHRMRWVLYSGQRPKMSRVRRVQRTKLKYKILRPKKVQRIFKQGEISRKIEPGRVKRSIYTHKWAGEAMGVYITTKDLNKWVTIFQKPCFLLTEENCRYEKGENQNEFCDCLESATLNMKTFSINR